MTIDTATVHAYEIPLERAYVTATVRHETREGLVLELDADGTPGLGEAAPLSSRTESLDQARKALEAAGEALEGRPVDDALAAVDEIVPDETPTARFAVELALLDAAGREADTPLARHLAATREDAPAVPDAVPVNATIPATDADATQTRASEASRRGFDTVKLKGTGDWEADLERVRRARAGAGSAKLRLDVNGSWPDADTALDRLEALAPFGVEYVEQPLPADDVDGMATLRRKAEVPIAADEPVTDLDAARELLEAEAADVLVLKPMVLGGPRPALDVAELAREDDTPVVVTSTIDGAIARAGALHTAAALGKRELACGLATGGLFEREPFAFDERLEHGRLVVPDTPGHGAWLTESLEET